MFRRPKKSGPKFPHIIRKRWLISCISLSIVPLIIGSALFGFNISNTEKQTVRNNEALLLQIQSLVDRGFYDVRLIAQTISADTEFNAFSLSDNGTNQFLLKRHLQSKLLQYCGYSSYIKSIYIYFWDTDQFITEKTVAPSRVMYHAYHNSALLSYEDWLALVRSQQNDSAMLLPWGGNETGLVFMRSLPHFYSVNMNATILIWIDMETITQLASSVDLWASCEMNLLLPGGELILPPGKEVAANLDLLGARGEPGVSRVKGKDGVTLSRLPSARSELDYLIVTTKDAYMGNIREVNLLFLAGLTLIVLGSVFFTARFIYRNYAPIREMLEITPIEEGAAPPARADEFSMIKNAILTAANANADMRDQLAQQKEKLLDSMLALLLHNTTLDSADRELLAGFLYREAFALMLIGRIHEEEHGPDADWPARLGAVLRELLLPWEDSIDYWPIVTNDGAVMLFNLDEDAAAGWDETAIALTARIGAAFAPENTGRLLLYPSGVCVGMEGVSALYDRIKYRLQYRLIFGTEYQPRHENGQEQGIPSPGIYAYAPEDEARLYNAIVSGNADRAAETFALICRANANLGKELQYCLLFDILGTVIRACNLISPVSSKTKELAPQISRLLRIRNNDDIYRQILILMGQLCGAYSSEHSKSTDKLKNEILSHIDAHYGNPNLSVESISDVFGRSRTYLFSLFKEDTGFSIQHHISQVRIRRAKELLETTGHSIQQIAEMVGYNSAMNFTRAFKRSENVTPSAYRELLAKQK